MTVELVELHEAPVREHMRATWRICCPLSIAVQILRHRSGSFNMTSGRYRTLNQDMVDTYSDITKIMEKIAPRNFLLELDMGSDRHSVDDTSDYYDREFENLLKKSSVANRTYDYQMQLSKKAKAEGKITNEEYKRFREFARYILPEGRMTELYCTFYLPDFIHYLQLRDSSHAQTEHVYVAQQMKKSLNGKLKDNFKIK
jgi:thymidylate synthase (FAD)